MNEKRLRIVSSVLTFKTTNPTPDRRSYLTRTHWGKEHGHEYS